MSWSIPVRPPAARSSLKEARRRRRFPLWTLLGVALVVALVVGSGALSSAPPTSAQRAAAIDSVIRCPSCEDLNVTNSTAETAVAVRATVKRMVNEGRSDAAIESYLVDRYGSSIVLDPPARGLTALVWILPVVGGLAAVAALTVFSLRRRALVRAVDVDEVIDSESDLERLAEQRRFLERSLADADAEYLAGDLSDHDYLALRQRDLVRLGAIDTRLAEAGGATTGRPYLSSPLPRRTPHRPLRSARRIRELAGVAAAGFSPARSCRSPPLSSSSSS